MKSFVRWVWDWVKSIGVALVVWFFLRTFLVEAFRIPSGSMENTLLVGDFLFVNKLLYGAEIPLFHKRLPPVREPIRGEILVFDSVEQEDLKVVKRLIGVPGDTLSMERAQLFRNGAKVEEPWVIRTDTTANADPAGRAQMRRWQINHYVGRQPDSYAPDLNNWGPIVVPRDSFFMMGDNRDGSYDGRYWGFLPRANVRGRPLIVYFSFNPDTYKPLPFLTNVRWGRLFALPH